MQWGGEHCGPHLSSQRERVVKACSTHRSSARGRAFGCRRRRQQAVRGRIRAGAVRCPRCGHTFFALACRSIRRRKYAEVPPCGRRTRHTKRLGGTLLEDILQNVTVDALELTRILCEKSCECQRQQPGGYNACCSNRSSTVTVWRWESTQQTHTRL